MVYCFECLKEGNKQRAFYGYNHKKPIVCVHHKYINMIYVAGSHCKFEGCFTRPTFGFPYNKAIYCRKHMKDGMIDVKNRHCEQCSSIASFGEVGSRIAKFCCVHKRSTDIDVKSKLCEHTNCVTHAYFGYPDGKRKYCVQHKLDGMISMDKRKCIVKGCEKRPIYGQNDEAQYCSKHKKDGMQDLIHTKCLFDGCLFIPSFGFKCDSYPTFCKEHKKDGMLNIACNYCNANKPPYNINMMDFVLGVFLIYFLLTYEHQKYIKNQWK